MHLSHETVTAYCQSHRCICSPVCCLLMVVFLAVLWKCLYYCISRKSLCSYRERYRKREQVIKYLWTTDICRSGSYLLIDLLCEELSVKAGLYFAVD